jgi:hypothetical protein
LSRFCSLHCCGNEFNDRLPRFVKLKNRYSCKLAKNLQVMVREGMRGENQQQNHMFSYLFPEMRVRKDDPLHGRFELWSMKYSHNCRCASIRCTPVLAVPSIAPEKLLRGAVAADALFHPQREPADGRDGLQPVVTLVCRSGTRMTKFGMRTPSPRTERVFVACGGAKHERRAWPRTNISLQTCTLLQAWASLNSFQPKEGKRSSPPDDPGNPTVKFRGERRSNETHASKTDREALLARTSQGKESKLSYSGSLLVGNRNGLIVDLLAGHRLSHPANSHHEHWLKKAQRAVCLPQRK